MVLAGWCFRDTWIPCTHSGVRWCLLDRDMLYASLQILLRVRESLLAMFYILLIFYNGNIQKDTSFHQVILKLGFSSPHLFSSEFRNKDVLPSSFGIPLAHSCLCQSAGPLYQKLAGHRSQSQDNDFILI